MKKETEDGKKGARASGTRTKRGEAADCRCREVSQKTAPELIKLMVDDLAFWRKAKTPK